MSAITPENYTWCLLAARDPDPKTYVVTNLAVARILSVHIKYPGTGENWDPCPWYVLVPHHYYAERGEWVGHLNPRAYSGTAVRQGGWFVLCVGGGSPEETLREIDRVVSGVDWTDNVNVENLTPSMGATVHAALDRRRASTAT